MEACMKRREFVQLGLSAGIAAGSAGAAGVANAAGSAGPGILDAGVREQQAQMASGKLTSSSLVKHTWPASPPSTRPARASIP